MNQVARVLARTAMRYIEAGREAGSETRLLLPGLTDSIAQDVHRTLTANDLRSFLIIRDDDVLDPSKEQRRMLAAGLTSVREGEMLIVAFPGQISRIQDSIIGYGGTVRGQAFSDEWPWILDGENPAFSFSNVFLPDIAASWSVPPSIQPWLIHFIKDTIVPESARELRKAELVLDELLGNFDAAPPRDMADPNWRFILAFIRHCGLPKPPDPNLLLGATSEVYSALLSKLTNAVTSAMEKGVSREIVEQRAVELAKGDAMREAALVEATRRLFDSMNSEDRVPSGIFMFRSCFLRSPDLWDQLDLDTISKLFTGSSLENGVGFDALNISLDDGRPGRVIQSKTFTNVYTVHGAILSVRARINRNPGQPTDLVALLRGQELASNRYVGDPLEAVVEINTGDIKTHARQVTVRLEVRQAGVSGDNTATHPVRLDLAGRQRPFFLLLLDSRETVDISDDDQEDQSFARIDVQEPQVVEILCFDPSLSPKATIDESSIGISQLETGPGHYSLDAPVDPAAALTPASLLKVKQHELVAAIYLGMEEVRRGKFTIEEELREHLHAGRNKSRLRQILALFNNPAAASYPHLGAIEGATRNRVKIARQLIENQERGGFPIVVNLSRLESDLSKLSLGNYIIAPKNDEHTRKFDPQHLLRETAERIKVYRSARAQFLNEIKQYNHDDGGHPIYAARPTFVFDNDRVDSALVSYLAAYISCLNCLHNTDELKNTNDKFILSWLDCVVCLDDEGDVPIILIGPWHPLVLTQRYMVQASLYDAASRFCEGELAGQSHRLVSLLAGVVGARWMPFAAPQNSVSLGAFHVSATSDPGWLIATSTRSVDAARNKIYFALLERVLGLHIPNLSEVEPRDFEGYLRDFIKAYPSRRSISMRIAANYSPRIFMDSARALMQVLERDFGQRLPGGLHLLFEEKPSTTDGFEWQEPPILAYHVAHDEQIDHRENPVDIHLLQGGRLAQFEQTQDVKAPPRGTGLHAVFYEPLQELNTAARSLNTSLHETGVPQDVDSNELGEKYRSILDLLDRIQNGRYLTTIRPGRSQIQCPWIITPSQYVDPAAMAELVGMEDKEHGAGYILWDYKLGISGTRTGYFTLSRVHKELQTILSGNKLLVETESARDILIELGCVGIALASEVVRSNTTAQGALGLVGALRLFQGTRGVPGVLKNGQSSVSFVLPVDSFEEVFRSLGTASSESEQRTDLLGVQFGISPDGRHVSIAFLGIEAKYVTSTLGSDRAQRAIEQARETVERIVELANKGREHGLERQAFLRLVSHGLRLSSPARDHDIDTDALVLGAILRGDYKVIDISPSTFVVSSEIGYTGEARIGTFPAAWIRLSPGHWPTPCATPSNALVQVIKQLQVFSSNLMASVLTEHPVSEIDDYSSGDESEKTEQSRSKSKTPNDVAKDMNTDVVSLAEDRGQTFEPKTQEVTPADDDDICEGVHIKVGVGTEWPDESQEIYFHPSNTELNQLNVGIVGDLGTGKTQKIKALVRDMAGQVTRNRSQPIKFLIFDYKGDYVGQDFVAQTGAKVVAPRDIPLNVLDPSDAEGMNAELDRTNFLVDVFRKIYGGIGPTQDYNLKRAIRDCYDNCRSLGTVPSIYDVHKRYEENIKRPDSVLSILSNFTSYRLFEGDLSKVETFSTFFSGVTVIDLKSLGTWDQGKNMLVVMFLNLFYDYMLKVRKKPFIGSDPQLRSIDSFLLVDEADQIMKLEFPVLRRILLQGREFGIGVILASQYLSHFKQDSEDYIEPLLTWILHKVPNVSPRDLLGIGLTESVPETADKIKKLKPHHSFYKTSIGGARFMRNVTFFE